MSTATEVLARPLPVLVPLINEEARLGEEAGIEHYRRAGEMLVEAKAQVAQGEWKRWLKQNFAFSQTTAYTWMKLVEVSENSRAREFRTLSEATDPGRDSSHRPAWHAPIHKTMAGVNIANLRQNHQEKQKEQRLVSQLARQIIDIGYKVLATKLHPDKGGSAEAMRRLNRAKSQLLGAI